MGQSATRRQLGIYGARTEDQNEQNLGAIGFRLEAAQASPPSTRQAHCRWSTPRDASPTPQLPRR